MCGQFSNPVTEMDRNPLLLQYYFHTCSNCECVKFYYTSQFGLMAVELGRSYSENAVEVFTGPSQYPRPLSQDQNKARSKLYLASLGLWSCCLALGLVSKMLEPLCRNTTSITTERNMCFHFRHTGTFTFPVWVIFTFYIMFHLHSSVDCLETETMYY